MSGVNQVANTRRDRETLAILARSGQHLPVCLTFGPTNGPEDFAFATDRVFALGRGRQMRFCTNWQIYADDITIRSGRWIDGVYYSDGEAAERLREAQKKEELRAKAEKRKAAEAVTPHRLSCDHLRSLGDPSWIGRDPPRTSGQGRAASRQGQG